MRVVITRAFSALDPDGINTSIMELGVALTKRGHECHVISGCGQASDNSYFRYLFDIDMIPTTHILKRGFFKNRAEQLCYWLVSGSNLINHLSPHMVIMNGIVPTVHYGFRVVVCHGLRETGSFSLSHKLYDLLMFRQADRIVATSTQIRDELVKELMLKDVSVIPGGLDISSYKYEPPEKRQKLVLHIGTSLLKNLDTTLRAFEVAVKKVPTARLYIVGNPTQSIGYYGNVSEKIKYLGTVSKKFLKILYSQARVVSAPLLYNTFSCTALEAFASGTPVAGTKAIHMLKDGTNGLQIDYSRDHLTLAKHITTLLEDDELWMPMSKNALETAKQFDSKVISNKYVELYHDLADRQEKLHTQKMFGEAKMLS